MGLLDGTSENRYYSNSGNYGNYQFISLSDIINNFMISQVGEGKLISKVRRSDVVFHAHRALAELSFDTFKSCKAQEVKIPPSLTMILPQDYVNYVKLVWSDSAGIEHTIYPTSKTSNPTDRGNLVVDGTSTGANDNFSLGENWSYLDNRIYGSTALAATPDRISFSYPFVNNRRYRVRFTVSDGPLDSVGDVINMAGAVQAVLYSGDSYTVGTNRLAVGDFAEIFTVGTGTGGTGSDGGSTPTTGVFSDTTDSFVIQPSADFTGQIDNIVITDLTTNQDITSTTWGSYSSATPSENQDDYQDDVYWPAGGERYGLDPQHAQANGSFFMDCNTGKIHFSSNLSGKTVILKYISDSLGTDEEMQVHKLAEEAMYKWIAYAVLSTKANVPEFIVLRFRKERFAETRKAKLRLSNIKLEEITQILRGKSKWIKH
jgi:hypothetical protein